MGNCMLCKSNAVINRQDSASRTIYNCPGCGVFVVSDLVEKEVRKKPNEISSYLTSRRLSGANEIVLISFEKANLDKGYVQLTVDQIVDLFPKNFTEQMDMALKNLELMSEFAGDEVKVENLKMAPTFYLKNTSFEALSFVIKSMQKSELIEVNFYSGSFFPCGIIIGPKGWDRLAALRKNPIRDTVSAFVSQGGKQLSDQFLKAVRKASLECEYHVAENLFGDESKVGFELIAAVKSGKIIVCDFTDLSGEAYYTAALAYGLEKICILTCHESAKSKLQIDTNQLPVIFWEKQEALYLEILNAIKARI